jgi:hypothetical protein
MLSLRQGYNEQAVSKDKESIVKKAEFGFGGILLGLIVIALALFCLNYFNVISLPFNFPFQTVKQQVKTSIPQNTIIIFPRSQKISAALEAKAEAAGYKIIYQGDLRDKTGRTILSSKERKDFEGSSDQFGWIKCFEYLEKKDICRGQGVFDHFEKIDNSEDYYLLLKDLSNNSFLKSRIIVDKNSIRDSRNYPTRLTVDDLNFLPLARNGLTIKQYGLFTKKIIDEINLLIKKGDILTIYTRMNSKEMIEKPGNNLISQRDEFGILVATNIFIRRFGGIQVIEK